MGRSRKPIVELVASGTYRPSRHGPLPEGSPRPIGSHRLKIAPILAAGVACRHCKKLFHPKSLHPKYCSQQCKIDVRKVYQSVCRWCDQVFASSVPNPETCSRSCQGRLREARSSDVLDDCRRCGRAFVRPEIRTQRVYCSAKCREKTRNRKRQTYLRAFQRQRQTHLKATAVEKICPLEVFERDKWTCRLCGGDVNRLGDPWTDPLYPTIDHIVPVSKGGPHTYENVRCAHRGCNTSRGNRDAEELASAASA